MRFCIAGAMAFMRAVHYDPPMKPLFTYYHVQSDELLGTWLFFFANVPFIPYSLIYLKSSSSNIEYWIELLISIVVVVLGAFSVHACYPSDTPKPASTSQPLACCVSWCCCCCIPPSWKREHIPNDWLASVWVLFWSMEVVVVYCVIFLLLAISAGNGVLTWEYGTG